jgi:hypothetical protein
MLKNDLTIENFHSPNMGQKSISNSNLVCPTLVTIKMGLWISFVYATIQHVITFLGGTIEKLGSWQGFFHEHKSFSMFSFHN